MDYRGFALQAWSVIDMWAAYSTPQGVLRDNGLACIGAGVDTFVIGNGVTFVPVASSPAYACRHCSQSRGCCACTVNASNAPAPIIDKKDMSIWFLAHRVALEVARVAGPCTPSRWTQQEHLLGVRLRLALLVRMRGHGYQHTLEVSIVRMDSCSDRGRIV